MSHEHAFLYLFFYDFPNKFISNLIVRGCFDLLVFFSLLRSYACYFFAAKVLKLHGMCRKHAADPKVMVVIFSRNDAMS